MSGTSSPFQRFLIRHRVNPVTVRWLALSLVPLLIASILVWLGMLPNIRRLYPSILVLTTLTHLAWLWKLAFNKPPNHGRLGWLLSATMTTLMLITIVLWVFVYPSGAMRDQIGLPEALYFASIALMLLATLALRRASKVRRTYDIQAILDITVMGASSAAVAWYYLIRPFSTQLLAGNLPLSIVDISPYGQIAVFTLASAILLQRTAREPSHMYAIAMLFVLISDVQLALIVKGVLQFGPLSTAFWVVGIALFVLDADRLPHTKAQIEAYQPSYTHDATPALRVLPYIVAAGALLLLIVGTNLPGTDPTTRQQILLFGASILLLLMLRQVVTLNENRRLTAHLTAANEELRLQATHDHLTWLLNRSAFMERFEATIKQAHADEVPVALIFTDLNQFKAVNDIHGHQVGDQLLVVVADAIRSMLPVNGFATRLGGDEFMIALPAHDHDTASLFASQLSNKLDGNVLPEHGELPISLAAGTAVFPVNGTDPDALINHADLAMYEHKKALQNA